MAPPHSRLRRSRLIDSPTIASTLEAPGRRPRAFARWSWLLLMVALVLFAVVAFTGRWTTAYDYSSGELTSTQGTGTESGGSEGPFTLIGRQARFHWQLNPGVDRIRVAMFPANTGGRFVDWEEGRVTARDLGGTEFSTTDRSGVWSLDRLPAGDYWVRYRWWTRGSETGRWSYQVEARLRMWERTGPRR